MIDVRTEKELFEGEIATINASRWSKGEAVTVREGTHLKEIFTGRCWMERAFRRIMITYGTILLYI